MNSLSREELELLEDPELVKFRRSLAISRKTESEAEANERKREERSDYQMLTVLRGFERKDQKWKEWEQSWKASRDAEDLFLSKVKVLCERLLSLEDDEALSRSRVERDSFKELVAIDSLRDESERRLELGQNWKQLFEDDFENRWKAERERAALEKQAFLSRPCQEKVDEAEIALLKSKIKKKETAC